MRTILLAGCAAVLLIGPGAAVAQTGTPPAEPAAREAPAQETAQETPAPAAPAEPSQAAPEQSAPARSLHAQEQKPSEPPAPPSASDGAPPSALDSTPPPPAAPETPPAARRGSAPPASAAEPPPARGRAADIRRACRLEARRLGLRGPDASGHMAVCLAQARLACTKEAVARTPDRRARNDYVRECLGRAQRRAR